MKKISVVVISLLICFLFSTCFFGSPDPKKTYSFYIGESYSKAKSKFETAQEAIKYVKEHQNRDITVDNTIHGYGSAITCEGLIEISDVEIAFDFSESTVTFTEGIIVQSGTVSISGDEIKTRTSVSNIITVNGGNVTTNIDFEGSIYVKSTAKIVIEGGDVVLKGASSDDPTAQNITLTTPTITMTLEVVQQVKEHVTKESTSEPNIPGHQHSYDYSKPQITPATCTETGEKRYFCTDTDCGYPEVEIIPALGHAYGTPTYQWSEDNSTCTATRVCTHDSSHKETESGVISHTDLTPATCTEKGSRKYAATFTNTAFAKQEKTVEIPVLGHAYGTPTYQWSEDNSTCTATRVCTHDSNHKETESGVISHTDLIPATCTEKGSRKYAATFTNTAFAKQEKTVEIPVLGHAYGDVAYSWSKDNQDNMQCTAERVCANDSNHKEIIEIVTAVYSTETGLYTATFTTQSLETQTRSYFTVGEIAPDFDPENDTYYLSFENNSAEFSIVKVKEGYGIKCPSELVDYAYDVYGFYPDSGNPFWHYFSFQLNKYEKDVANYLCSENPLLPKPSYELPWYSKHYLFTNDFSLVEGTISNIQISFHSSLVNFIKDYETGALYDFENNSSPVYLGVQVNDNGGKRFTLVLDEYVYNDFQDANPTLEWDSLVEKFFRDIYGLEIKNDSGIISISADEVKAAEMNCLHTYDDNGTCTKCGHCKSICIHEYDEFGVCTKCNDNKNLQYLVINEGVLSGVSQPIAGGLAIPDSVTAIDNDAFTNCQELYSIDIPGKTRNSISGAPWGIEGDLAIFWSDCEDYYTDGLCTDSLIRTSINGKSCITHWESYENVDGTLVFKYYRTYEYYDDGSVKKYSEYEADGTTLIEYRLYEYNIQGKRISLKLYSADNVLQWENQYDENGNLIKQISYYSENCKSAELLFENGKAVSEIGYYENGKKRYETEYEDGQMVKDTWYEDDGETISSISTYEYDTAGNRTKEYEYEADGTTLIRYWEYEYNNQGRQIGSKRYSATEVLEWENQYDENGNRIKGISYYSDGKKYYESEYNNNKEVKRTWYETDGTTVNSISTYEYDTAGNRIKQNDYTSDGKTLTEYRLYEYDNQGNRISLKRYSAENILKLENLYDGDGNVIKGTHYYESGKKNYEIEYDNNKEVKRTWYGTDGETISRISTYEYNATGKMIKEYNYEADGKILIRYWEYEYDNQGTQTSSKQYSADDVLEWEAQYDENGEPISETGYYESGKKRYETEYSDGLMSKRTWYETDGIKVSRISTYEYDVSGKMTKQYDYEADGETLIRYWEYEYDNQGKRTGSKQYSADDFLEWEAQYDENGKAVSEIGYYENGKKRYETEYEDGQMVKRTWYETDGETISSISTYEYNATGKITRENYYAADGKTLIRYWEYEYDNQGTQTSSKQYSADDVLEWEAQYDENGEPISEIGYYENGKKRYETEYSDGLMSKRTWYETDGTTVNSISTYEYDVSGKMIKEYDYEADGKTLIRYWEYEYDNQGTQTSSKQYSADNVLQWENQYDENGNRIKAISYSDGKKEYEETFDQNDHKVKTSLYDDAGQNIDSVIYYDENGRTTYREDVGNKNIWIPSFGLSSELNEDFFTIQFMEGKRIALAPIGRLSDGESLYLMAVDGNMDGSTSQVGTMTGTEEDAKIAELENICASSNKVAMYRDGDSSDSYCIADLDYGFAYTLEMKDVYECENEYSLTQLEGFTKRGTFPAYKIENELMGTTYIVCLSDMYRYNCIEVFFISPENQDSVQSRWYYAYRSETGWENSDTDTLEINEANVFKGAFKTRTVKRAYNDENTYELYAMPFCGLYMEPSIYDAVFSGMVEYNYCFDDESAKCSLSINDEGDVRIVIFGDFVIEGSYEIDDTDGITASWYEGPESLVTAKVMKNRTENFESWEEFKQSPVCYVLRDDGDDSSYSIAWVSDNCESNLVTVYYDEKADLGEYAVFRIPEGYALDVKIACGNAEECDSYVFYKDSGYSEVFDVTTQITEDTTLYCTVIE